MTVRRTLLIAARDLYGNSWRLLAINGVASTLVVGVVTAAAFVPPALVLLPLAGPFVLALARAAVTQAGGEDATIRDAVGAARADVRRGLALGVGVTIAVALGEHAFAFYAGRHVWVLAALVLELGALLALHELALWTFVAAEPERPLRDAAAAAARVLLRRPARSLALGGALVVVDGLLCVAGVLPFLMLGGAYSFLAAAHVFVPERELSEEAVWQG